MWHKAYEHLQSTPPTVVLVARSIQLTYIVFHSVAYLPKLLKIRCTLNKFFSLHNQTGERLNPTSHPVSTVVFNMDLQHGPFTWQVYSISKKRIPHL
jgi:hypothetical protein